MSHHYQEQQQNLYNNNVYSWGNVNNNNNFNNNNNNSMAPPPDGNNNNHGFKRQRDSDDSSIDYSCQNSFKRLKVAVNGEFASSNGLQAVSVDEASLSDEVASLTPDNNTNGAHHHHHPQHSSFFSHHHNQQQQQQQQQHMPINRLIIKNSITMKILKQRVNGLQNILKFTIQTFQLILSLIINL